MSMFPHTVTIYNVVSTRDEMFHETISESNMTFLRGVLLEASKGANVRESGVDSADAVTLYIPLDVEAVDAVTGEVKNYVGPMEYSQMEDHSKVWTMSLDGENIGTSINESGDSFFVKGEVVQPGAGIGEVKALHDGVYNITKVDPMDFGGLQHFEAGGA